MCFCDFCRNVCCKRSVGSFHKGKYIVRNRWKIGNKICHMTDDKKAELRENLSELKLVIIDEMSLVGADMLYRIHLRLCTIFNTDEFLPFAKVNILIPLFVTFLNK